MSGRKGSAVKKAGFRNSVFGETQSLIEGHLSKLNTGIIKRYQQRYFVLETHYRKYFENEAGKGIDSKPKGVINLEARGRRINRSH